MTNGGLMTRASNDDAGEIADQLEELAGTTETAQAETARVLAADLRARENLDAWSRVDVRRALEREASPTTSRTGAVLTLVRNALVFLPVAFTWYAIAKATATFNDFTEAGTAGDRTFLYWWQQGMDGALPSHLRLSSVATIDVFLVALIILVTVIAQLVATRDAGRAATRALREDTAWDSAVLRLELYLASVAFDAPERFKDNLAAVATRLASAAKQVQDAAERLDATSTATRELIEAQTEIVTKDFSQVAKESMELVSSLDSVSNQQQRAGATLDQAHDQLMTLITDLAASLAPLPDALRGASETLSDATTDAGRLIDEGATAFSSAAGSLDSAAQSAATSAAALDAATGNLSKAMLPASDFASNILSATEQMGNAVELIRQEGEALSRILDRQVGAVQDTEALGAALRRTAASVEFGTSRLREDLEAIHMALSTAAGRET
jgi:hypothetical protein